METTMYDSLLQLPLFQGLGKNDFTEILSKVKFQFAKYKAGERIVKQGDSCNKLVFLLSGSIIAETEFEKEKLTFGEVLHAPYLLEPFSLYGLKACYRSSYIAQGDTSVILINKEYVATEFNKYETFRINFINLLSYSTQRLLDQRGKVPAGSAGKRIIEYLQLLSTTPRGEKYLRIKMEDLATILGATRLRISQALNRMDDHGCVVMQRMEFHIPDLQELVAYGETLEED